MAAPNASHMSVVDLTTSPTLSATSITSYDLILDRSLSASFVSHTPRPNADDSDDEIVYSVSEGSASFCTAVSDIDEQASDDDFVVLSRPCSPMRLVAALPAPLEGQAESEMQTPVTAPGLLEVQMSALSLGAQAPSKAAIGARKAAKREAAEISPEVRAARKAAREARKAAKREAAKTPEDQAAKKAKAIAKAEIRAARKARKAAKLAAETPEDRARRAAKKARKAARRAARRAAETPEDKAARMARKRARKAAKKAQKKAQSIQTSGNLEMRVIKLATAVNAVASKEQNVKTKSSEYHSAELVQFTGLGARPIVDDFSDIQSVVSNDNESVGSPTLYEEASTFISSFLANPQAKEDTVCRLTLLQSLIIELGLATPSLPDSLSAAKKFLKSRAFLNIREYIAVRANGPEAVQRAMFPNRSALIQDIRKNRNHISLKWAKQHGLQVLLVGVFRSMD